MKSGLAIATPEHSECFSINMFILYSMTDLIALVNVKARFFKNSSEVLAGRFMRNVANENLDGLPGDNVHGLGHTSEDKSTIFNNFKFDYSRVGEFYFEPFPLVGKSINLPHSLLRTLNTVNKI